MAGTNNKARFSGRQAFASEATSLALHRRKHFALYQGTAFSRANSDA
jgi:hypothetical protein